MEEKSIKLIKKVEEWLCENFRGFEVEFITETVLMHKVFNWLVTSDYLLLVLAFNDLTYTFNGAFRVNMEEEDGDDYIQEEFKDLPFDEFIKAVEDAMEKHKDRISAAKYLQEMVTKNMLNEYRNNLRTVIADNKSKYTTSNVSPIQYNSIDLMNSIIRNENR